MEVAIFIAVMAAIFCVAIAIAIRGHMKRSADIKAMVDRHPNWTYYESPQDPVAISLFVDMHKTSKLSNGVKVTGKDGNDIALFVDVGYEVMNKGPGPGNQSRHMGAASILTIWPARESITSMRSALESIGIRRADDGPVSINNNVYKQSNDSICAIFTPLIDPARLGQVLEVVEQGAQPDAFGAS